MSVENKLKWLGLFDTLVKSKRQEIAQLRASIYKSSSFLRQEETAGTTESLNVKIIDQTEAIARELEEMYDERDRLVRLVDELPDPVAMTVVRLFYIHGQSWAAISAELQMSVRSLQNVKRKALQELETKGF